MSEVLSFPIKMTWKSFIGIRINVKQWEWHRTLLNEVQDLRKYFTNFNQIWCFTNITISNSIWFCHFTAYKLSTNEGIEKIVCRNCATEVCHSKTNTSGNRSITFQTPRYWTCEPHRILLTFYRKYSSLYEIYSWNSDSIFSL